MSDPDEKYIIFKEGGNEIRFRKSLLWDLPAGVLDLEKNKRLILERVFSRGNPEDFRNT